jgi:mRNA-degrading endonuclease RelE of RelBE toxin-antitoxin system
MPSLRLVRTHRFRRAYRKLDERYRELVKKALAQFARMGAWRVDRTYPGLRVKRLQGTNQIWEMRAGRDMRITVGCISSAELEEGEEGTRVVVLRNVGHHDPTLKKP